MFTNHSFSPLLPVDWGSWAIVSNNLQGYGGQGAKDTGASSQCAPDLDHTNETVRKDAKEWIYWLFNDVGYGALRIDMAPGYATRYQVRTITITASCVVLHSLFFFLFS